jgi:hypothetical protein
MGYNAVYSVDSKPKFRRNITPPSSGLKNKPRKKPARIRLQVCYLLQVGSLIYDTIPALAWTKRAEPYPQSG